MSEEKAEFKAYVVMVNGNECWDWVAECGTRQEAMKFHEEWVRMGYRAQIFKTVHLTDGFVETYDSKTPA